MSEKGGFAKQAHIRSTPNLGLKQPLHDKSTVSGPSRPAFSSVATLEAYAQEQKQQRQRLFMSSINEQLQFKAQQTQQQRLEKQQAVERRITESQQLRLAQVEQRRAKAQRSREYRLALDFQSGKTEKDQFQANAEKFFGWESKTMQGYSEARDRFFGADSSDLNRSIGSIRLAKTLPRTTVTDPITGAVRHFQLSRSKIYPLGNSKHLAVAAKISESPPPRREESRYFGKKVSRKVIFNPLTGVRTDMGDALSRSFEGSSDFLSRPMAPSPFR